MSKIKKKFNMTGRTALLLGFDIFIFIFLAITAGSKFLDWTNLKAVLQLMTYNLLLASGMTFVLMLAGIDLSVGSQIALESVVIALLLRSGVPLVIALLAGLAIAVFIGLFNGFLSYKFKLAPFLVTLGMMMLARGTATVLSSGQYVSFPDASPAFIAFGRFEFSIAGKGFSLILTLALLAIFIFSWVLNHYDPLNRAFMIGANPDAAKLSGMNVGKMVIFSYVVCALFAFLAAVFMTANNRIGYANYGVGYEMNAIAAAVVGGAAMSGGKGSFAGACLGVLMLALITNGFVMLGGNPSWQQATTGIILLLAIASDVITKRKSGRK